MRWTAAAAAIVACLCIALVGCAQAEATVDQTLKSPDAIFSQTATRTATPTGGIDGQTLTALCCCGVRLVRLSDLYGLRFMLRCQFDGGSSCIHCRCCLCVTSQRSLRLVRVQLVVHDGRHSRSHGSADVCAA